MVCLGGVSGSICGGLAGWEVRGGGGGVTAIICTSLAVSGISACLLVGVTGNFACFSRGWELLTAQGEVYVFTWASSVGMGTSAGVGEVSAIAVELGTS